MEPMPAEPHGLTIEAVEWLPSGAGTGLVRVRGRWATPDRRPVELPVLVVRGADGKPHRHASLPDPRAGRDWSVWRGAYIVRAELVDAGQGLSLELDEGALVELPAPERGLSTARPAAVSPPVAPPVAPAAEPGGEVIDRAVLAERRARRAEAAEQAQARIAAEALKAVEVLELAGAELEERVETLTNELERHTAGEPVEVVRERLAAAEARAGELEGELEAARRLGGAELERALADARGRADHDRAALGSALVSAAALRDLVREWTFRLRAAEVARTSDAVRLAVLEARRLPVEAETYAARSELADARRRAAEAEAAVGAARTEAAEVQAALAEAREEAGRLGAELAASGAQAAELERLRAELEGERGRVAAAQAESRSLATTLEEERRLRGLAEAELAAQGEARALAESELLRVHAEGVSLRAARTEVEAAAADAVRRADAAEEARETLRADVEGLREELAALEAARATAREEADRLAADAAAAARDLERLRALVGEGEQARAAARDEAEAARAERDALRSERDELAARLAGAEPAEPSPEAEGLREQLDAALADVEALRSLANAAEETRAAVQRELEALQAELRERPPAGSLTERVAGLEARGGAPAGPEELRRRAEGLAGPPPSAPSERPAPILADLDAAAAALRARAQPPLEVSSPAAPPARGHATGGAARAYPWLRGALVKLAHDEPRAAARLLTGLLPAQAGRLDSALDYDLVLREAGIFAITVDGAVATVRPLAAPRPRGEAQFRLTAAALPLAELLAGHGSRPRRFAGPVRVSGRHARRARRLAALVNAAPSLAEAARAGARLEPAAVYRAFPYAIHPSWTRGHAFTVGQEVTGEGGGSWLITVADGAPVTVAAGPDGDGARPDAIVTLTRGAFDALLRREAPPAGERPRVRGDRAAVALLKAWTDRAQGDPAPDPPGAP